MPTSDTLALLLLLLACAVSAPATQIAGSPAAAPPGGSAILAMTFASEGAAIAGVQFDITYDDAVASLMAIAGDAQRNAGKSLYQADIGPHQKRVLVVALNQNTLADGALVNVFVSLAPDAAPGDHAISLSGLVATDPSGAAVPGATADGVISVAQTPAALLSLQPAGVLSAAGLTTGAVAPGEILTLMGSGLAPPGAGLSVLFDGFPAPLLFQGATQINAVVPYEIAGKATTNLQIASAGSNWLSLTLPAVPAAPAVFTLDSSGTGNAAALNQDGTVNGPLNPAQSGSIVSLFASGAGQTDPPGVDGQLAADPLPQPLLPVAVQIGGAPAEVLYAGAAPGLIAGVLQVNCRVPPATPSGNVPVVLAVGTYASPVGVTLAVR